MPAAVLALFSLRLSRIVSGIDGLGAEEAEYRLPMVWSLAAGALWGLSDWLRSVLFTGFPWLTLGYSQAPASPLAGFAPCWEFMVSH